VLCTYFVLSLQRDQPFVVVVVEGFLGGDLARRPGGGGRSSGDFAGEGAPPALLLVFGGLWLGLGLVRGLGLGLGRGLGLPFLAPRGGAFLLPGVGDGLPPLALLLMGLGEGRALYAPPSAKPSVADVPLM
jgi:hypothetical protein